MRGLVFLGVLPLLAACSGAGQEVLESYRDARTWPVYSEAQAISAGYADVGGSTCFFVKEEGPQGVQFYLPGTNGRKCFPDGIKPLDRDSLVVLGDGIAYEMDYSFLKPQDATAFPTPQSGEKGLAFCTGWLTQNISCYFATQYPLREGIGRIEPFPVIVDGKIRLALISERCGLRDRAISLLYPFWRNNKAEACSIAREFGIRDPWLYLMTDSGISFSP